MLVDMVVSCVQRCSAGQVASGSVPHRCCQTLACMRNRSLWRLQYKGVRGISRPRACVPYLTTRGRRCGVVQMSRSQSVRFTSDEATLGVCTRPIAVVARGFSALPIECIFTSRSPAGTSEGSIDVLMEANVAIVRHDETHLVVLVTRSRMLFSARRSPPSR
ncbi:hypothetical protein BD309DRAFT_519773 [Dichomitus squalens]|nr:hypothetical protein BD309DRAFT_519773 [Dichomitus squalens]